MLDPRTKIGFSTTFLVVGGLCGGMAAQQAGQDLVDSVLVGAYVLWALFWGVPPFWAWWRRLRRRCSDAGSRSVARWALQTSLSLSFLAVGAYCFSVFGGGVVCFAKAIAASRTRP